MQVSSCAAESAPLRRRLWYNLVKNGLDVMALSIGDGANDVAMIQEADVGVGIAGEEGRQAVMSSDYAIGQFRFLQRLVLVHGRWSYRRLAETIANFFYKVSFSWWLLQPLLTISSEHRVDIRSFLVPDLQQLRREILVRLHLHSAGESGVHVVASHPDGCS